MKEIDMEIVIEVVGIAGTEEAQEDIKVDLEDIEDEEVREVVIDIEMKNVVSCVIVNCM
jgi:hypothetical protein